MASWQGSSNPVPILEKIYRDLHDIKLHLMPSYAEREGAAAAAAAGAGAAAAGAEAEWIRKSIGGKKHLWNPASSHCYHCETDGSQGAWAGLYNPKTQKIDTSVPEPEHNGGSRKQKSTRRRSTKSRKTRRN